MKVILNKDIENLGEEGDIKEVAAGYGRNYLLPRKLVMLCSKGNLAILAQKKNLLEKRRTEKRNAALGLKTQIEASPVELVYPASDNGKLFGSITSSAIQEELEKRGLYIERKKIEIPGHTIKMVGDYQIKVRLYDKEDALLTLSVKPMPKEK